MPIYEYQCPVCGIFEEQRSISESSLPNNCKKCGRESSRVLSTCNTQFIGSGFYSTDYKKSKAKEPKIKNETK